MKMDDAAVESLESSLSFQGLAAQLFENSLVNAHLVTATMEICSFICFVYSHYCFRLGRGIITLSL